MLFRPTRSRRGPDRFLPFKMILLALGGATAIAGFMLEIDWLVTAAVAPLVIGLGLNFRRSGGEEADSDVDDAASGPEHESPRS